jgi:hypothetical protein
MYAEHSRDGLMILAPIAFKPTERGPLGLHDVASESIGFAR